ncbi:MAG TPA: ATP-binding protein [Phycisphaerales bacterium]|nr:ATP-binding protein [Phycisphaerales bacterium]
MRIRKKLIFLHTFFSLLLAAILVVALRPAVGRIVLEAEEHEARLVMSVLAAKLKAPGGPGPVIDDLRRGLPPEVTLAAGGIEALRLDEGAATRAHASPGEPVAVLIPGRSPTVIVYDAAADTYYSATVSMASARSAVVWMYVFLVGALLGVYATIALALEVLVLPRHVYTPIRAMLAADDAVRRNQRSGELIPQQSIPADELGQIMRSRNDTVRAMRDNERRANEALAEIERVAADLQKKNALIEAAQRNLADADRLASLGILSAGLAHEMNTPLAVVKGLAEKLVKEPYRRLEPDEAALLVRVVGRLERLSESLLDFARVRPPTTRPVEMRALVEEAWTLVSLDREARRPGVEFVNRVPADLVVPCDGDRIVQVLVNLLRNGVDASSGPGADPNAPMRIEVRSALQEREGKRWASIVIADTGPGIAPEILGRLFEPFATTRLDSRGTGLGLAVSLGIIREHGGALVARNRDGGSAANGTGSTRGAEFEILLPMSTPAEAAAQR